MAEYQYQGVDKNNVRQQGKLDAQDEGQLRMMLRGMGIRPTRITKVGALNADIGSLLRGGSVTVPLASMVAFTRQLQVLIGAGVPLVQAIEILAEQAEQKAFRGVLLAIKEQVSGGKYLWEALAGYPKIFPKLYLALIRAGEASGSLEQMLKRLSRYMEDADRLAKMLKSAMIYPAMVIAIGGLVITAMLVFVIPKFEEMLKTGGQELPLPTQIVITISHFLVDNIWFILVAVAALVYVLFSYFKTTEGKGFKDRILFRAPLFGPLQQKAGVARFCRTMGTLLQSGVNLIDAIDICRSTIDNAVMEDAVAKIRAEVEGGKTLGVVVGKTGVFPKMAIQMISVGESSGALDKMLERVADFYESEVETLVGGLTKLIEPLILVFLGGTVGGLMIAMYLPIFKLAGGSGE